LLDGQQYRGNFADLQTDEQVTDDALVERRVQITAQGKALLAECDSQTEITNLLNQNSKHKNIYQKILKACTAEQGCTRDTLEETLCAIPSLHIDAQAGVMDIYPQYFLDNLEKADGLVWRETWRTTEAGRAVIDACR
jgi:hypothetical protein